MKREPLDDAANGGAGSELDELCALPAHHPGRVVLPQRLAALGAEERQRWLAAAAEGDELRARLETGPGPSPAFLARLHEIPAGQGQAIANSARVPGFMTRSIGWRPALAAALLIGLGIAAYFTWFADDGQPHPLKAAAVTHIADLARAGHAAPPPLEVASADPAEVAAGLKRHAFAFEPTVLRPYGSDFTLEGEAAVPFGKSPAAVTRWRHGGREMTLYQISSKALGVPDEYLPSETCIDGPDGRERISIWGKGMGDGACTWVLVRADTDEKSNPFAYGYGQ